MRLTLRTLLAYLDDVLDPADKEELAKKIETSDFAKDLVHQTRDSVRRLRLSAPQVIGAGMGMDPNSVAEYLDNVLPPEQVGDYERICLESDVHLAETAACHHVLTMVLGEPAEVDPRSRQRMYMIPAEARERRRMRAEAAHTRGAAAMAVSSSPASAAGVARPQAPGTNAFEVPEYLRTPPWWQSRGLLAAVAAMLIIGTAFYIVSDMMGWFGGKPEVAGIDSKAEVAIATAEKPQAPTEPIVTAPAPATPSTASEVTPATEPAATPQAVPPVVGLEGGAPQPNVTSELSAGADATVSASDSTAQPATADQDLPAAVETPAAENSPDAANAGVEPVASNGADTAPAAETASPPVETTAATVPPLTPPQDSTPPTEAAPIGAANAPGDPPQAVAGTGAELETDAAIAEGPPELGTYLGGTTVLLRHDATKGGWFRMAPRTAVVAGERLLALPEFRPQITLTSGLMLDMSGGTQVVVLRGDEAGEAGQDAAGAAPMIELLYGRIILTNTSNADSQTQIKAGSHVGKATLTRNATLAIEVERPFVPGNDPRKTQSTVEVTMYAPNGGVTWADASGELVVEKPSRWTLVEGAPAELIAESAAPEWIDREPVVHPSEQRYGAPAIESMLVSDRPVDIQLLELFKGRDRREVKSLVTRSGIHVGLFAPFIEALRDPGQKMPTWRTHIETLRTAMAQSPETAEQVFQALSEQHGRPAAADLYEMLCGYNAEQIGTTPDEMKSGALSDLIDRLEGDLDYRVLAVHNLQQITGKQLMPNPAANETVRKQNIRRWRDRLEKGELEAVKPEK